MSYRLSDFVDSCCHCIADILPAAMATASLKLVLTVSFETGGASEPRYGCPMGNHAMQLDAGQNTRTLAGQGQILQRHGSSSFGTVS